MIINVRGTSGSGKSTVVRAIMALAPSRNTVYLKGTRTLTPKPTKKVPNPESREYARRLPLFYRLGWPDGMVVTIPGHYETACGGCDTLPTYDLLFDIVRAEHALGHHVLFEGVLVAHDKKRCTELWNHLKYDPKLFQIVELRDSLQVCLDSVQKRRDARGAKSEFNPANTSRRYGEVVRSCEQLEAIGIPIHRCLRDEAPAVVQRLLNIPALVAAE